MFYSKTLRVPRTRMIRRKSKVYAKGYSHAPTLSLCGRSADMFGSCAQDAFLLFS